MSPILSVLSIVIISKIIISKKLITIVIVSCSLFLVLQASNIYQAQKGRFFCQSQTR